MNSTHTMNVDISQGELALSKRFAKISLRFLIHCEVFSPLEIENFEKLVERNPQTRFMALYYSCMALGINSSLNVCN